MKRLGMLLVLLSVSMFALGCEPAAETTPAPETPTVNEPIEGETEGEPKAETTPEAEEK